MSHVCLTRYDFLYNLGPRLRFVIFINLLYFYHNQNQLLGITIMNINCYTLLELANQGFLGVDK